jgi:hypothetical protein
MFPLKERIVRKTLVSLGTQWVSSIAWRGQLNGLYEVFQY